MPLWSPEQVQALASGDSAAAFPGRATTGGPPEGGNIMGELFQAIKADVGKTLRSILYLPEAVATFGRDDGADEETKSLRRRALATAITTVGSFGLGTLASTAARGVGVPLLGTLLKLSTSAPGVALESGLGNVAFGRLDTAPGEDPHDLANFATGAGMGLAFRGAGSLLQQSRATMKKWGVEKPVIDPRLNKAAAKALEKDGGMGGGAVEPAVPKTRKNALVSVMTEINQNDTHVGMRGVEGRDARLAMASQVLGRPIKTFSEITEASEFKSIRDALRARRGEMPSGPKMQPVVTRMSPTMSAAFPDAAHKKLYDIGTLGKVTEPEAQFLSTQLGVPAEEVLEKAHLYSNLTKLATEANKGETVLFKMPPLDEAIDMMPAWIQTSQRKVASSVSSPRPRVGKTMGDVAVERVVKKNTAGAPRVIEVPEEGLPEVGGRKGPPPPPVEAIRVGKRLIEVGPVVKGKVEMKFKGRKETVSTKALVQRLQEHVSAGRVVRIKRGGKWVTKGGGKGPEPQGTITTQRAKAVDTMRKGTIEAVRGSSAKLPTGSILDIVKAFTRSQDTGRPEVVRAAIDRAVFGKEFGATTAEALRAAGDLSGAAEYETRKALQEQLYRLAVPLLAERGGKVGTGAKGVIPDFVAEIFGESKVVGKKPVIGSRVKRPVVDIPIGDRAKMRKLARTDKRAFQIKRILNRIEPRLGTKEMRPGDRQMAADLRAQLEKLEQPKTTSQAIPERAAALARDKEARERLAREGVSMEPGKIEYRKLINVPDAPTGEKPELGGADIIPAVRLKDGSVVVDMDSKVDEQWMGKMAREVGKENIEKVGVIQEGEFFGRPVRAKEALPEVPPGAPPEEAVAPTPSRFGRGARGPRPVPEPEQRGIPAHQFKGGRYNYLMERAGHPDPNISEVAKMHLKEEFGAEYPDPGPAGKSTRRAK